MNITQIIVLEIVIILVGVVGLLFYLSWKRGKEKVTEFEKLLDNFDSKVDERKAQLIQFLEGSYALKTEEAEESAGYMIEAEKQFLLPFIKQQMEQTPADNFYENLCELLDQYLYFVPTINIEKPASNGDKLNQQDNGEVELLNTDTDTDDFTLDEPKIKVSNEPDSEKEEQVTESDESDEEEVDWGDAFAESGDEMDEATKAGFESETKVG